MNKMDGTKITSALLGFYGFDIVDNGDETFSYERKVSSFSFSNDRIKIYMI